jgi:hypothetical protein
MAGPGLEMPEITDFFPLYYVIFKYFSTLILPVIPQETSKGKFDLLDYFPLKIKFRKFNPVESSPVQNHKILYFGMVG